VKIHRWLPSLPNFEPFNHRDDSREADDSIRQYPLRVCVIGLGGGGFHWEAQRIIQFVKRPLDLILVFSGPKGGLIYWNSKDAVKASYVLRSPSLTGDSLLIKLSRSVKNVWQAFRIISVEQPDIILAIGSAQAIPFGFAARILGKPLWFIESVTRIRMPSRTGHWIFRLGLGA
jgi:UDP-N-acetylglucosamine:LPS N-acetylglucosamine transferase